MSIIGADPPGTVPSGREIVLTMTDREYIDELEATVVYLANWSGYLDSGCTLNIVRDQIRRIKEKRATKDEP